MKKNTLTFLLLLGALALTGCKDKYDEGYKDGLVEGKADGQSQGYADGFDEGFADGYDSVYDGAYNQGHADGYSLGQSEGEDYYTRAGYNEGHADGYSDGQAVGQVDGYDDGYAQGYDEQYGIGYSDHTLDGYNDGAVDGYNAGYDDGEYDGYHDGYDDGYDDEYTWAYWDGEDDGAADGAYDGYNDGYDDGYSDGYSDGSYDYDLGYAAKSQNPAVRMAAMVNADLIDYAKLQKFDARSAASIGMNRADNGTVDMEKLASLKERHFLNQMAKQLSAKFGLSSDRAADIATVAHQFNKLAGTRELTEKDANVFAVEVIGKNLKEVEAAVSESLKGESAKLDQMLKDIAGHNQTTPENVNRIIGEIFF